MNGQLSFGDLPEPSRRRADVPKESAAGKLIEAKEARDDGIKRANDHATDAWKRRALAAVRELALNQYEFIADDLWKYVERPHEPRATGPVMLRARREGWIAPTDRYRPVPSKLSHAAPVRIWRSRLLR